MAVTRPRSLGKTATLTTSLTTPVTLFTMPIVPDQVMRIRAQVVCKQLVSTGRALFERVGLFSNDGVQSFIQGTTWHATSTEKTDPAFGLSYVLNASNVEIQVKNANAVTTKWFGRLDFDVV